ncbi:MAG: VWA domain-containing protein [Phycisphaerae bacterium]|nr:VWA domain-containing protein [Phycisphaerae bacterium]
MSWPISLLAPWAALAAAALVPALVLLYFLKLKRQDVPVSSTLLWQRAVQDLQVNSPFQRLRNNLLLLLQLLLLLLAILALTDPIWNRSQSREQKVILLLDRSASMNSIEADKRTRLDAAKESAKRLVDDMGKETQMMVIAFADRAHLAASFTDDKALLKRQIDAVEPTDGASRLRDAMTLAESYSTPIGEGIGTPDNPIDAAHLVLLSDGIIADAAELTLRRGSMEIIHIGDASDNVGVVNMDVRRDYERPDYITVVARVRNFGETAVNRDLALFIDKELKEVRVLGRLAPGAAAAADDEATVTPATSDLPPEGSEVVVVFDNVPHAAAGQIEVRLSGDDALAADNQAFGTIEGPRPLATLLVTHGNFYLSRVLAALPGAAPTILTPEQYEAASDDDLLSDGRLKYDVAVIDGYDTGRLPPGNYLFFGGIPKLDDVKVTGTGGMSLAVDWNDTHPVLRHVAVNIIAFAEWNRLQLPEEAETLIEGPEGAPLLAYFARDRRQYLVVGFGVFDAKREHLNTNWIAKRGFPAFMYNAVQFLAGAVTAGNPRSLAPGDAASITAQPGTTILTVRRPSGHTDTVSVRDDGMGYYANMTRAGLYTIDGAVAGDTAFAVNLFDDHESQIRPNKDFRIGDDRITATADTHRTNRMLWPYLILAALGVLFVEWIVYNRRVLI